MKCKRSKTRQLYEKSWGVESDSKKIFNPLSSERDIENYINEMSKCIKSEGQEKGDCWLINEALKKQEIYGWDLMSFLCAYDDVFKTNHSRQKKIEWIMYPIDGSQCYKWMIEYLHYLKSNQAVYNSDDCFDDINREIEEPKKELSQINDAIKETKQDLDVVNADRNNVKEEAAKIIENANNEAAKIIENANNEATKIIENANNEAKRINELAQKKNEEARKNIYQGFISTEDKVQDVPDNVLNASKDDVEVSVHNMENDLRDYLNEYRDNIQTMLYSFRTSLYETDYRQLCNAYQKFYLFATVVFEKRTNMIISNDNFNGDSKVFLEKELNEIQGLVLRRTHEMQLGLEKLGLTMIHPNEEDEYNSNEHEAYDAEIDIDNCAAIKRCICPGIKSDIYVICKAKVEICNDEY